MLIDFHIHLFPDTLAPKALGRLSSICSLVPVTDGTVTDTLEKMDDWGVDEAVVMHIATSPKQQHNVNEFAMQINSQRLHSFGSVHYGSGQALEELERIQKAGLRGIKLHPDYQDFDIDDLRLYPIYERISQLGLLLCFHMGYDPLSPKHIHATPAMLCKLLHDFPHLQIIGAHLGGMHLWDEVETLIAGKSVYLDTAFIASRADQEQSLRIIRKHGAQHVLFASDCPWQSSAEAFAWLDALPLTAEEKDLIFYKNAQRLLGL